MVKPDDIGDGVQVDLYELLKDLRENDAYTRENRTAKTLVHTDDMRMVLVVMGKGSTMAEHDADATATVQVLEGNVVLKLPRGEVQLSEGGLLTMAAGLRHDVQAVQDSAFLLTLGWSS